MQSVTRRAVQAFSNLLSVVDKDNQTSRRAVGVAWLAKFSDEDLDRLAEAVKAVKAAKGDQVCKRRPVYPVGCGRSSPIRTLAGTTCGGLAPPMVSAPAHTACITTCGGLAPPIVCALVCMSMLGLAPTWMHSLSLGFAPSERWMGRPVVALRDRIVAFCSRLVPVLCEMWRSSSYCRLAGGPVRPHLRHSRLAPVGVHRGHWTTPSNAW